MNWTKAETDAMFRQLLKDTARREEQDNAVLAAQERVKEARRKAREGSKCSTM